MGFFSFRREPVADDDLRDALFAAAAASDTRALKKLVSRHLNRVVELFPTWKTLPPAVLADPSRTKFWAEGVIGVASAVAELGDASLFRQLQRAPADNPPLKIAFRDAQGRVLTADELRGAIGPLQYEVSDGEAVPPEANALHQQGRQTGARGNHHEAVALFTRAAERAPRWPYPVYDRAFTYLLMKDLDAALSDYRRTLELSPRGFFTAVPAVDTLAREQQGEFPPGLYLAYVMLETVNDRSQRRHLLAQFVEKYPGFAPGWQKFADVADDNTLRLEAIEKGLAAKPDPHTKGMLLLNKALALNGSGSPDIAVRLLTELVASPDSAPDTEALARVVLEQIAAT